MNIARKAVKYIILPFSGSYIAVFAYLLSTGEYGISYDIVSVLFRGTVIGIFISIVFAGYSEKSKQVYRVKHKKVVHSKNNDKCSSDMGKPVWVLDGNDIIPGVGTGYGIGLTSEGFGPVIGSNPYTKSGGDFRSSD